MSREFESYGRKVLGEKVDLPAGVRARNLETGKDVTGPAVIWRPVGAPPPGVQGVVVGRRREAAESEPEGEPAKKRGRPPGSGKAKGGEAPPDL